MSIRQNVITVGRDEEGDTTALCGAWGVTQKLDARAQIDSGAVEYHVDDEVKVIVVEDDSVADGFYLRTTADTETSNNLAKLEACSTC